MPQPGNWGLTGTVWAAFILVSVVGIVQSMRGRRKANKILLEWAKSSGAEVIFGDPPEASGQNLDSLQNFLKQNDHPFLHPIYDMAIPERNVIRFPNQPNAMLLSGFRHEGKSSTYPEAWFIVDTEETYPTGQANIKVGGSRAFSMLDWKKIEDLPRQFSVRSPDPKAYSSFATADLLSWLQSQSCVGFRTEGKHIELCFDGTIGPKTWDELYPKAMAIVERFRQLLNNGRG